MADDPMRPDDVGTDANDATAADAALAIAARHALHDEELVVALATGSLDVDLEIEKAQSLVDRCTACRDLHKDIAAIGTALRMDAKGTVAAPRDFRLTLDDARRLGGPVSVGGFMATLRRSMRSFAPQLGASMAALGVVGLLVGSVALGGGAASAPISAGSSAVGASQAPEQIQIGAEGTGPKASDRSAAYVPAPSTVAGETDTPTPRNSAALDSNPVVWLLGGSVVLLIAGLVLLVVAFRRGRTGDARTRDS